VTDTDIDIDLREPEAPDAGPVVLPGEPEAPRGTPVTGHSLLRRIGSPDEVRRLVMQLLLAFSLVCLGFVAFVGSLSAFPQKRAQSGLERALASRFSKYHGAYVGGAIPSGTPIARLDIPRLHLHQIVVEGTSADNLRKGPGHLSVTPLPGQPGNAVLAGHRWAFGGPFSGISTLRRGDSIVVVTGQGTFTYKVTGHQTVSSGDITPLQATQDNRLTLVTAANLSASQRWIVTSELSGDPQPAPAGRPTVLSTREGGLVGQHGVLPELALWVEVLLLTAVGTVLLYRLLPRWSSYLITTPVVIAVLWIVYANLARLLPATL
jgi:sortase A